MPAVFIDRIDNLSFTERNGVIRSLTRKYRVLFNPGERTLDFSTLTLARNLCPAPFTSPMDIGGNLVAGYKHLALIEATPSIAENDPCCVDVLLKYDHILDGPNQGLVKPSRKTIYGKGRSSIVDKTTNFYIPYGYTDNPLARVQILVGHCFNNPKDDGAASQCTDPTALQTAIQGGEVSIPFPQANFGFQGFIYTNAPWDTVWKYIAKINSKLWCGKPMFTWVCSEVQFEVLDPAPEVVPAGVAAKTPLYKFSFEFQYNIDTWNPTVAFHDQRTGRPPARVILGSVPDQAVQIGLGITVNSFQPNPNWTPAGGKNGLQIQNIPAGYWNVPALQPIDFNAEFGATFEGLPPPGAA